MHIKTALVLAAALGLLGTTTALQVASAADLGRRPPPPPVYVPPAPLPYIWTGCYIGGNIAGARSHVEVSNIGTGGTVSGSDGAVAGGGQIGCDYQTGAWVFGLRDMFDATSLSKTFTGLADSRVHWFDTLTVRGGYLVVPNVLLYVQGGAAWTNTKVTFFDVTGTEISNDRTGWTAGGGIEWMFAPQWSVFAEYNFMDFGTRSVTACGGGCGLSAKANIQYAAIGLNYRFGWGP